MKFLDGLFRPGTETKGAEEVRHAVSGSVGAYEDMPYRSGWSTERAVKDGMEKSTIVYKCVDTIATAAARLPVVVRNGGRGAEFPEVTDHPVAQKFAGMVNEYEHGHHFLYRTFALMLLAKQGVYIEHLRSNRGRLSGLYILPSDQTFPVPGNGKFVDRYEIEGVQGQVYTLPEDKVIWVRKPHPTDAYSSLTPMEAAGLDVDTNFYARLFNRDFMLSDGRPAGLVAIKGGMADDDVDELRRRFGGAGRTRANGGGRAGEVSVVAADQVSWVDLHTNQRDAQYVESMGLTKKDIMLAFGVPESVMGDASGRTFCVDEATEALTQRGWVDGRDITTDDVILAVDPADGALKWSPVRDVYRNESYDGPAYRLRNQRGDFLVTEGHKWLVHARPGQGVRSAPGHPFALKAVEDLTTHDRILTIGTAEAGAREAEYSTAFVEVVGWAVTEGHFVPNDRTLARTPNKPAPYVVITQMDYTEKESGNTCEAIRRSLKEAGATFSESHTDGGKVQFRVRGETAAALRMVAPDRVLSPDFLLALTAAQRHTLLAVMMDADGAKQRDAASWTFAQKRKEQAEAFVLLATLCGYSTSLTPYESDYTHKGVTRKASGWRVIVRQSNVTSTQHGALTEEHLRGFVWCPTTDYGTFVARRGGKVIVTGNSNADAEKEVFWEATMLPLIDLVYTALDMATGSMEDGAFLTADYSTVDVLQRNKRENEDRLMGLFNAGLITADEFREGTGRSPFARPGSRVLLTPVQGKTPIGPEGDEKTVGEAKVIGTPEAPPEGGAPAAAPAPQQNGVGARGRATRNGVEKKHADHDQSSHGRRGASTPHGGRVFEVVKDTFDPAKPSRLHLNLSRSDSVFSVQQGGVVQAYTSDAVVHGATLPVAPSGWRRAVDASAEGRRDKQPHAFVQGSFDPSESVPDISGMQMVSYRPTAGSEPNFFWASDGEYIPTDRVFDTIVMRDWGVWAVREETKHMGPGPHPNGTPQAVHSRGLAARPDGSVFEVSRLPSVDFLAQHLAEGVDFDRVKADQKTGAAIRDAYHAAPDWDADAVPAYTAMASEVEEQYRLLTEDLGVSVEVTSGDPYPDVAAMVADVRENKTLKVLSTATTGGHPFFTDEQNDKFRAVHDAFGHAGTGRGFDRHGEEAAWVAHSSMFSPLAARAMTTETRGQNSTMVWGDGQFPREKVTLLPDFAQRSAYEFTSTKGDAQDAADADNLFETSGIHHASNGRWKAGVQSDTRSTA